MNATAPQRAIRRQSIPGFTVALACGSFMLSGTAGCGLAHQSIPYGLWEGRGSLVYEVPQAGQNSEPQPQRIHREYTTSLHIEPRQLAGEQVIYLSIHSQRGALPQLQDETRLEVALQEDHKPADNTTLYRVHGFLFNPEPSEKLIPKSNAPLNACAIAEDGVLTLLIQYMDNFTDTFEFRGATVRKSGMLYGGQDQQGILYWRESLAARGRPQASYRTDQMPPLR